MIVEPAPEAVVVPGAAEGEVLAAEEAAAPVAEEPAALALTGLPLLPLALGSGVLLLLGFGLRRAVAQRD